MRRPRIHLIEFLDSAGSAAADAHLRAAVLERVGYAVQTVAIRDDASVADGAPPHGSDWDEDGRSDALPLDASRAASLARWIAEGAPERVVIACAQHDGGALARALPKHPDITWWPAGLAHSDDRGASASPRWRALFASEHDANRAGSLDTAVLDTGGAQRRRLPLWDGDFVLAPVPLSGAAGTLALQAFATLAADQDALDLVVLSHPNPAFEREARSLGVGTRVHFVGPAPREAEWAWWSTAAVALFTGQGAVSGGLVLRGLAAGCPIVVAEAKVESPVAAWLARHGALAGVERENRQRLAATLERALERAPGVMRAIERGRERCAAHDAQALSTRLRGVMPATGEAASEAA
jgi:hypothetical protein